MIEITINGKACTCEKGEFLLEVARRNGFYIPTLCHHPGVAEQGCCRVCLVEVVEKQKESKDRGYPAGISRVERAPLAGVGDDDTDSAPGSGKTGEQS